MWNPNPGAVVVQVIVDDDLLYVVEAEMVVLRRFVEGGCYSWLA